MLASQHTGCVVCVCGQVHEKIFVRERVHVTVNKSSTCITVVYVCMCVRVYMWTVCMSVCALCVLYMCAMCMHYVCVLIPLCRQGKDR